MKREMNPSKSGEDLVNDNFYDPNKSKLVIRKGPSNHLLNLTDNNLERMSRFLPGGVDKIRNDEDLM